MAIRQVPPHWVDPISKTQRKLSIPDLAAQGLPRPEQGIRTLVHRDGHDADPRRRHRRRGARADGSRSSQRSKASTAPTSCSPTARASSPTRSSPRRASAPASTSSSATSACSTPRGLPTKTDGEPVPPRPLVRRLHADARRPAARGEHRRPQGGRRESPKLSKSGRTDSNCRPLRPKRSALPG